MSEPARRLPRAIRERLADLRLHRDTLLYAMEEIGDEFSRERFVAAATSRDPAERAKVLAVERGFEILMNMVTDLTVQGLNAAGLRNAGEEAVAPREFRRLRDEGGISGKLCDQLIVLNRTRNDLQREYPTMQAQTLHSAVASFLDAFGRFIGSYTAWLREKVLDDDGTEPA